VRNKIYELFRESCNDVERETVFSKICFAVKRNTREVKRVALMDGRTRNERMRIIRLKAGIWKLRGIRRGCERGSCPFVLGVGDAKHMLLTCPETIKCRQELVCSKCLNTNEDTAHRKIISCKKCNSDKDLFLNGFLSPFRAQASYSVP
jgi:hypothetical protein